MASVTRGVIGAMKTALQGINGSGGYTCDLSGSDRVKIGRPLKAEGVAPPCAWLAVGQLVSDHGEQLGRYTRTLTVDLEARCPASDSSPEERELIALDLLDDICTALETDRTLGGRVLDIIIQATTATGAGSTGQTGVPRVLAEVVVYWRANSAAGV